MIFSGQGRMNFKQSRNEKRGTAAAALAALALFLAVSGQARANVAGNPGFEEEIGSGVSRNWDNTNGATRVNNATLAGLTFGDAPQGSFALRVPDTTFTFQTFDNVKPGDSVIFSARAQSSTVGAANGGRLKIEFKEVRADNSDYLINSVLSTTLANTTTAPNGAANPYVTLTAQGIVPPNAERVVLVFETTGAAGGDNVFDDVIFEVRPAKMRVMSSKSTVSVGEPVAMQVQYTNSSGDTLTGLNLHVALPPGFRADDASVRLNGRKASTREGSLIVSMGDIGAGQTSNVGFVLVPTSGVTVGQTYVLEFVINNGMELSDRARVELLVKGDPVFDEGTLIGKVFHDANQNGVQDSGEPGIPWVKLVTEEGIIVVTDEHGRYHVPALKPGRHLVKVDGHTLPDGTRFITESTYLVKTTPGIMNKANFAVLLPPSEIPAEFQESLTVRFTQGLDTSRPSLSVDLQPEILKTGLGYLEKEAVFTFHSNYPDFVKSWYLEIRDQNGQEVWTGYGVSAPPAQVTWSGQTEEGLLVKPGIYSYPLKVEDAQSRQDWTPLYFFRVLSKSDPESREKQLPEISPVGDFNIFKDGKASIPLVAKPTVRVEGKTVPGYTVTINSHEVPVDAGTGRFTTEFYVSPGEKEYIVESKSPEGETTSYRKTVKVKDSQFFMVALGEEQLGHNFSGGNAEVAGDEGENTTGFYQDGRLSYYLKGKIKGNLLIQSHYDSEDKRSAFFRNLDPDDYYPIYGDDSTRDYEAINTRGRFYLLVEKDRSYAKYGSYQTEFNDTELATYNRTLSGFKGGYEDTKSTSYGDPKKAAKVFYAQAQHRADHNEFAATGGSLYYLRNRNVLEGSEKLRVETRDKIQDITIDSYDLQEGTDYEIDYRDGRILLSRPLSSMAASDTLVSSNILDGSPVYLVADYEFDAGKSSVLESQNSGVRAYTHMGDHIRIGGTAVQEKRNLGHGRDYDMRGVDLTLKAGRNTKITAEYAESKQQQTAQSVSYDGGLTFADLGLIHGQRTRPRENAYLIKGQTQPFKKFNVAGYVQGIEPSFSNDHSRSQEGTKKYGLAANYRITDTFAARYRFDTSSVMDQLLPLVDNNVSAAYETQQTHVAQLGYDDGKYLAEAEYMEQRTDLPNNSGNLNASLLSEYPFDHAVALKAGYRIFKGVLPYAKFQTSITEALYQAGGGVRYELSNKLYAYIEEMFGNIGDSTYFGIERMHENNARSYANIRMRDRGIGSKTLSSAIGSSYSLTEKTRIFSEREYSTHRSVDGFADILGLNGQMNEHWDYEAKYERRHLDSAGTRLIDIPAAAGLTRTNSFNTVSGALAYASGKKLRARTALEVRRDSDVPKSWQIVSRNSLEYRINEDLSYLGKLDYGKSRFTDPGDTTADFMEFSTGFAFRPVNNDKLNMLSRYTYIRNLANDEQFLTGLFSGVENDETAHIVAVDLAYDLHRYLGMVEKLAWKRTLISTPYSANSVLHNFLWVNRFNFHVTRKWDVAAEYRLFWQFDASETLKHGPLLEVDREFYDYVRMGFGYNFTEFDDDLRNSNRYSSHGPFVRMTGKF